MCRGADELAVVSGEVVGVRCGGKGGDGGLGYD